MKGRIVFLIQLKPGTEGEFLRAYNNIRYEVAKGVPGHLVDQVCQSPTEPLEWLITSEWQTLDHFREWEKTEGHRELAKPLRECIAQAKSLKYEVREETSH